MKLLFYSPAFLPHVGGLEYNMASLAEELCKLGDEVVVVTTTPAAGEAAVPYGVVRNPAPVDLLRWVRWCDVYHQANVSLRGLWPLCFVRRVWVVSHHGMYRRASGRIGWRDRLKRLLLRWAHASIAVSEAVARDLETPSVVVPNAYRAHLFRRLDHVRRAGDLLFVGRLVSDKGVACLLEALALLRADGAVPGLAVVGEGPEEPVWRDLATRLGVAGQVSWRGPLQDEALVEEMNRHAVLVVPSLWPEPFGIVALEGIACGCVVVGSEGGGLGAAIGPCGLTFPNGDARALAGALSRALSDRTLGLQIASAAPAHLAAHRPETQAAIYRAVMAEAVTASRAGKGRESRRGW